MRDIFKTIIVDDIFSNIYSQGSQLISDITGIIKSKNIPDELKTRLMASKETLQAELNSWLDKGGVLSKDQMDSLQEEIRQAKKDVLESEYLKDKSRAFLYIGGGIAALLIFWILTTKNKPA